MCSSGPLEGRLVSHCADFFQLSQPQDRPQLQNYLAHGCVRQVHFEWQSVLSCTVLDDFRLTQEEADQYHYLRANYQCRQVLARPHPVIANTLWHSPASISFLTNVDPSETSCSSTPT